MDFAELSPYLTGPSSALFVALLFVGVMWKTFHATILPLISGAIDRHLQQIDTMAERHSQEHAAIITGLTELTTRIEALRNDRPPQNPHQTGAAHRATQ